MGILGTSRLWNLYNLDTDEKLQGQFVAQGVTEEVSGTYAEKWALSRQHSVLQFVHGNMDIISFNGRFFLPYEPSNSKTDPKLKIQLLKKWTRRDLKLGRPPILSFWIGDAHLTFTECILEQITNINYAPPSITGQLKDVTFSIQLRQWWPYDISLGTEPPETKYHHAKRRDYFEMLAYREYGNPMLGDAVRKRHLDKVVIEVGDIIRLPSKEAIATETVLPSSEMFSGAFTDKQSNQFSRRSEMIQNRSEAKYSHIL